MNRSALGIVLLGLSGSLFFSAAGYYYWALSDLYELLRYYGLEGQYYTHSGVMETASNLRFGMAKFLFAGAVSWICAGYLIARRQKRK